MKTGMWFQAARGRAMIRNRAMRDARRWKTILVEYDRGAIARGRASLMAAIEKRSRRRPAGAHGFRPGDVYSLADTIVRQLIVVELESAVRRARSAHRTWRQYRQYSAECGEAVR